MLRNVLTASRRKVRSVATETYWSRGAIRWGDTLAVRYLLRPAPETMPGPEPPTDDPDYLSHEVNRRLAAGDVRFELCLQRFKDAKSTPIEDTAVAWSERVSPPEPVAVLTIGRREAGAVGAEATRRAIDAMAFNPWNTTDSFRPLGNLNRARKAAYDASVAHRRAFRWREDPPLRNVVLGAGARRLFSVLNRRVEWHRLPVPLSLLNLQSFRHVLRRRNLIDTEAHEAPPTARAAPQNRTRRPGSGAPSTAPSTTSPSRRWGGPRLDLRPQPAARLPPAPVQRAQPDRRQPGAALPQGLPAGAVPQPARRLLDPVPGPRLGQPCPPPPGPPGRRGAAAARHARVVEHPGGPPEPEMRIAGNVSVGGTLPDGSELPLFRNQVSHWWDGSEVYGTDEEAARKLRDGAKLRLSEDGYLPLDAREPR